jgi:N utilization substance protein B
MNARRQAREIALQVLYALDANPETDADAVLAQYYARFDEERAELPDRGFAEILVREVSARRGELDELLGQVSKNWRLERMARVDRNVLRLALYELKYRDDIPAAVTLNEAIELAKRFGAAEAPAFVNGLLDSALHTLDIHK